MKKQLFDFFRPPNSATAKSSAAHVIAYLIYTNQMCLVGLVSVAIVVVLLQMGQWQQALKALIFTAVLFTLNLAGLKLKPSISWGKACIIINTTIGLWLSVYILEGYAVPALIWLPLLPWSATLWLGHRIGIAVTLLNTGIYILYHEWMMPQLPRLYNSAERSLVIAPSEFRVAIIIFVVISSVIVILVDLNRRQSESMLAETEKMRQLHLQQTSMAVIHCDPSGNIKEWNPAAEAIFGYTEREVLGYNAIEFLAVQSDRSRIQSIIKTLAEGDASSLRKVNRNSTKDGAIISCEWFNTAICGEDNRLLGWIFSAIDITERIQKERELQQAKELAESATEAKSAFLANMSHEIRTPMNGVIGMTSLLSSSELNSEQVEFVETIRKSGNALLEIINEILDFSKIESGKLLMEEHPFDIRECAQDALNLFLNEVQQKGITLSQSIAEDVPAYLLGDSGRLRQILVNLIGNASKFTEQGGITLNIELDGVDRKSKTAAVHFAVQDTGIGIPADKIDTLFDSFNQADISTTRKYGGTGLGLTITKLLVEIMNGQIWIDSTPGEGATFHFVIRLPIVEGTGHRMPSSTEFKTAEGSPSLNERRELRLSSNLSILLVEDNQVNQKVALHLLKRMGYSADVAGNGLEAVDAVKRQYYDLILMDVQMPDMDGLEATRYIRDKLPSEQQPRIIAMTAAVLKEDRRRTIDAGMDGFVSKPIKVDELREVLRGMEVERTQV